MTRGGNSASHRASRDLGEAFEAVVDKWHEMAGLRGALVHVVHNAPPSKFVHGRLIYEEAGVADYSGVLWNGGVLASEAKSVAPGERLMKSRISSKQQKHLDAVAGAGGNALAFLLVEFRVEGTIAHHWYAIPWFQVCWKVVRTAESLDENDIAQCYRVESGTDYLAKYHQGSPHRFFVGAAERRKRVYPTQ